MTRTELENLYCEFYNTKESHPLTRGQTNVSCSKSKKIICFLDELNRAPLDVRQSSMQLVLERQIHEHILPTVNGQRTVVVAAINPSDEYQVDELDPALLDRFLSVEVEADAKVWLNWARKNKINSVVRDFIAEHPDRIHWTPADGGIGATPRSWAKLGAHLDNIENVPPEIVFQIMKGKIGTELGAQFYTFFKNYVNVVKLSDIEQIVEENSDKSDIEDVASIITEKIQKQEAVQKTELAEQLKDKYRTKSEMFPLLVYLYAVEIEICVSFLKSMMKDVPQQYKDLANLDGDLNNKELFKRIVQAANV